MHVETMKIRLPQRDFFTSGVNGQHSDVIYDTTCISYPLLHRSCTTQKRMSGVETSEGHDFDEHEEAGTRREALTALCLGLRAEIRLYTIC